MLDSPRTSEASVVSQAELANTLRQQGLPVAPTDQALSSARLTCLGAHSGLTIQTYNITELSAAAYAAALMTAGIADASVVIAAPTSKPVTGEAALVGALKAASACLPGAYVQPERERLAYAQLKATRALAGNASDLARAWAVFLDGLHAVITRQAQDEAAIDSALDSAAARQNLVLDDAQRAGLANVLQQLRGLDFGEYAHGYRVEQAGPDRVRVVASEAH